MRRVMWFRGLEDETVKCNPTHGRERMRLSQTHFSTMGRREIAGTLRRVKI